MRASPGKPAFHQLAVGILAAGAALNTLANPTGLTVQQGSATTSVSGSQLTITTSQNAFLNWQSFNIGAGETTIFNQPDSWSVVINRIGDQNPSQIYGSLQANGLVVLMNASGFYFGPNSFVSAAGLIVSTANCVPPQNTGGSWTFNGPPPLASIVNYGQIKIGSGGSAFLIADQIQNYGTIEAPGGTIGLAAGQTVLLSERPDGRGMSMAVTLPQGSVDNQGRLIADGGTIAMNAKVVNQDGLIQANSVRNVNGTIELVASDQLTLGADSEIVAHGDDSARVSSGGEVTLQSGNTFSDSVGSRIDVSGGARGGNGGNVDISAPNILSLNSTVNAGARAGWSGGVFTLDPVDIVLGTVSSGPPDNNGTIDGTGGDGVFYVDVNNEFQNITAGQILLKATGNIYVGDGTVNSDGTFSASAGVVWDLSGSTGHRFTTGQLMLQAGNNITFVDGSQIIDANNWSVTLQAGYNFANNSINYGVGSIYLNGGLGMTGSGSIQTAGGNIDLQAGQDILVGSGFVRTTGGGSVSAWASAGDINTGTYDYGYVYNSASSRNATYYQVDPNYGTGGLSTEAGGDVTLIAGGNVTSYLPGGSDTSDAGTGAFGPQAGNVTIVAGGNVTGHFVEANGTGKIYAGVEMDANGNPVTDANGDYLLRPVSTDGNATGSAGTAGNKLALSLIAGGWTVDAAQDIYLQEVRNPNGVFNTAKSGRVLLPTYHYFNYAADAYVNLSAGNAVVLGDSSTALPRASDNLAIPFIYAPILNISAGAGGVTFDGGSDPYNQLILFPSALGSLTITTTGGGSLMGNLPANADGSPSIFNLIVSDSSLAQYLPTSDQKKYYGFVRNIFGLNDFSATPIHENSPTPIVLNISGDMTDVLLAAPEAAQITVGGDMINSRFQGMNLSSDPSQSVQVTVRELDGSLGTATVHPGVTSINVTGDIINRSEFTTITLPAGALVPDIALLAQAIAPSDVTLAQNLAKELFYDSSTGKLTIQGALTPDVLSLLLNVTIQVYVNGQPQYNSDGSPVTQTVSIIDEATAAAFSAEYASLGAVPSTLDSGYLLGGGGQFNLTARSIDLGSTLGIQSQGVSFDTVSTRNAAGTIVTSYPLAQYFTRGADINVTLTGKNNNGDSLDMFSTTISTLNGGNITIDAGDSACGNIIVGSDVFAGSSSVARGIFTTAQGDVSVIANGDINLNGSRIATYDGGNVTVASLNGNIDAGNGASSTVTINAYYVDPSTRAVYSTEPQMPFSGILALTFPQSDGSYPAPAATLGNILVEAPNGTVTANKGGILQLALNYESYPDATTVLLAGYDLLDSQGNLITAGNLPATDSGWQQALHQVSDNQNIDIKGSGVIASNARLYATGDVNGLIYASNDININAQQNVNVVALGQGNVNVSSANGTISGTIIGVGGVSVSGSSIDASLVSANVSGSTSGQSGLAEGTAANATSQGIQSEQSSAVAANSSDDTEDEKKKKDKEVALAQKTGRVTVVLPPKPQARNQSSQPQSPEPRT